ncbi:MAG: efflux transporter outer membrane subunit [Hyphomonadaceae bacterium]|nr:efflux transporter outer membrane subunit [Hyphomonadaceae bacterium]
MSMTASGATGTPRKIETGCNGLAAGGGAARPAVLMAALLLAACAPTLAAAPELRQPQTFASERALRVAPESAPTGSATPGNPAQGAWPGDRWWESYGDPQLSALIEEGLRDSPSLEAAAARVRQADALAQGAGAANLPDVSANASVASVRQSLNMGFPDEFKSFLPQGWNTQGSASLRVSQQLDFFGRNRAKLSAARADAAAAEAEAAEARLQLSTAIAQAYADLSRFSADLTASQDVAALRERSAQLVTQRREAGLENRGVASQADAELYAAQADIVAARTNVALTRNRIAALLGKGPDRGLDISAPSEPALSSPTLPTALAADLIGRRPDIVAARQRAEGAAQRVRAARADFYPNVDLAAVVGLESLGLDVFSRGDSRFGQIGPALSLPIFSMGRLEGAYRGARAGYDEAVATYNQTLADALRDVADALVERRAATEELERSQAALTAAEEAHRVARLRYEGGLSSYVEVLTVENRLVTQRRKVTELEARAFASDIALVRALGGGYSAS